MAIILDHQLREHIPHNAIEFPITYFAMSLVLLPNGAGPLHWHPDFEIITAECGVSDYQVGKQHIIPEAGASAFVNGNIAKAADISRSEAKRCFHTYMGCSYIAVKSVRRFFISLVCSE